MTSGCTASNSLRATNSRVFVAAAEDTPLEMLPSRSTLAVESATSTSHPRSAAGGTSAVEGSCDVSSYGSSAVAAELSIALCRAD